jgi:hypothetical protein
MGTLWNKNIWWLKGSVVQGFRVPVTKAYTVGVVEAEVETVLFTGAVAVVDAVSVVAVVVVLVVEVPEVSVFVVDVEVVVFVVDVDVVVPVATVDEVVLEVLLVIVTPLVDVV